MLTYRCNARCLFCSQGDFDKTVYSSLSEVAKDIYSSWKDGYRRIGFTGGEPLVSPLIFQSLALAKKVGYGFIRIQTNGIKLGDPGFCEKLAAAGLTFCKFSLTSDTAEEHDRFMGVKGAHAAAVRGIKKLQELKIRISINIVINRFNYKRLNDIIKYYISLGVSNFVIVYPNYVGNMAVNAGELGVSLSACAPYFVKAADMMESFGIGNEILFLNVPACFLKGRESLSIGLTPFNTTVTNPFGEKTYLDDVSRNYRKLLRGCEGCAYSDTCSGMDIHYTGLFGENEVSPVSLAAADRQKGAGEDIDEKDNQKVLVLTDNEKCFIEVLKNRGQITTSEVLRLAKDLPLCRDCIDGNAVLNASVRLIKKGIIEKKFFRGRYLWKLSASAYAENGAAAH